MKLYMKLEMPLTVSSMCIDDIILILDKPVSFADDNEEFTVRARRRVHLRFEDTSYTQSGTTGYVRCKGSYAEIELDDDSIYVVRDDNVIKMFLEAGAPYFICPYIEDIENNTEITKLESCDLYLAIDVIEFKMLIHDKEYTYVGNTLCCM